MEQRRGRGPLRRSIPAARGSTAARDRGKRDRVGRRFDPRPHLVLGWRAEAGRREQAAAAEVAAAAALRSRRKG